MSKNNLNLVKIILSILSSFIGIQSNKNRERDFSSNKPITFIITGILLTFFFILALYIYSRLLSRMSDYLNIFCNLKSTNLTPTRCFFSRKYCFIINITRYFFRSIKNNFSCIRQLIIRERGANYCIFETLIIRYSKVLTSGSKIVCKKVIATISVNNRRFCWKVRTSFVIN